MNRKQRRAAKKKMESMSPEEQNLSEKISLFNQLEEECLACTTPFDKRNRKMVETWNVVVREDQTPAVRLYCPECWDRAQTIAAEYMKQQEQINNDS
jgi:hypothetical protein